MVLSIRYTVDSIYFLIFFKREPIRMMWSGRKTWREPRSETLDRMPLGQKNRRCCTAKLFRIPDSLDRRILNWSRIWYIIYLFPLFHQFFFLSHFEWTFTDKNGKTYEINGKYKKIPFYSGSSLFFSTFHFSCKF